MGAAGAQRHPIRTLAVTGTNGKTTTATLMAAIAAAAGERCLRVTTLGAWLGNEAIPYDGSLAGFEAAVDRAVAAGADTLVVETTSRSLATGFAERWPPDVAVFTNLTHDHLSWHGTPEDYLAAKTRLFLAVRPGGVAVLNAADQAGGWIGEVLPARVEPRAYRVGAAHPDGRELPVRLSAGKVAVGREGTRARLDGPLGERLGGVLALRLVGEVHVANACAAAVAADAAGHPPEAILRGLQGCPGVPGRFQVVSVRPVVVVDYAHTPDALARALETARAVVGSGGRVLCVFGCGGERDRAKRPEMGRIADGAAGRVVITSDNPRGEDPGRIMDAVVAGGGGRASWHREPDRAHAIRWAIGEAGPGDAVVIAGKGHERWQEVGGERRPFSDVEVAARACETLGIPVASEIGMGPRP